MRHSTRRQSGSFDDGYLHCADRLLLVVRACARLQATETNSTIGACGSCRSARSVVAGCFVVDECVKRVSKRKIVHSSSA
jgi:hypothetical protein